jgi:hypothetical protein
MLAAAHGLARSEWMRRLCRQHGKPALAAHETFAVRPAEAHRAGMSQPAIP